MKKELLQHSFDHVTDDQIRRWRTLSPKAKLQWLENANRLLWQALPPEKKALRERFRHGIIDLGKEQPEG